MFTCANVSDNPSLTLVTSKVELGYEVRKRVKDGGLWTDLEDKED